MCEAGIDPSRFGGEHFGRWVRRAGLAVGLLILAAGATIAWRANETGRASQAYQDDGRVRFELDFAERGEVTVPLRFPGRDPARTVAATILAVDCPDAERAELADRLAHAAGRASLTDEGGTEVWAARLEFPDHNAFWLRGLPLCGSIPYSRPNADGSMGDARPYAGDFRLTVRLTNPAPAAGVRTLIVQDRLYEFEFIDSLVNLAAGASVAAVGAVVAGLFLVAIWRFDRRPHAPRGGPGAAAPRAG